MGIWGTKMNNKIVQWFAASLIMDGLLTAPGWRLRGAGTAEAVLGLVFLNRNPIEVTAFYRLVAAGYAAIDPGWR
jgi:hypothetical protein